MLNRLEAPARLVIRTCIALFTGVVIFLLQSVFWTNAVSASMRAIIIATAALSYFRPHYGLLALAVLAPLGQVGSRTLDSNMRGAEALVLAFLAGTLVRGWTLRGFRSFPSTRLETAALIFGLIVAASCVEQIWFLQVQRDYPWPFFQDVLSYAGRNYLISSHGFGMIFNAMLLLEGLALLVYVANYCRLLPSFASRLVAMLVVGAVAAAGVNFSYLASHLIERGPSAAQLVPMLTQERWSFHVGDVNAAGSFFAMGMFLAFGLALGNRANRIVWAVCGSMLGVALWLTASRTAILAVVLIVVISVAKVTLGRSMSVLRTSAITLMTFVALSVIVFQYFPSGFVGRSAEGAVRIRWLFLGTTWRMLLDQPLFGVGVGQYALWSPHFSAPEMINYYTRENAHNYFAQIAGELGLLGLATFLWVLAAGLWVRSGRSDMRAHPFLALLAAGLAVFILTWLAGHPLLVPEVAYPFWLALGVVPGVVSSADRTPRTGVFFAVLLGGALAFSIPTRVENKTARIDFTRITYGISERTITSRARFFVASSGSHVTIPLRARRATPDTPVTIDIFVNEQLAETVTLTEAGWGKAAVALQTAPPNRAHQIDLRINESHDTSKVEVGEWSIISRPDA